MHEGMFWTLAGGCAAGSLEDGLGLGWPKGLQGEVSRCTCSRHWRSRMLHSQQGNITLQGENIVLWGQTNLTLKKSV